ncbi:MAG: RnfABCDGE type electron transport complex subunit A [Treponema sp.]|jgi:electron transport complex protein RnfA|nr:RnfABCDGE type electron transport complex subunit A [Treponema sp.]
MNLFFVLIGAAFINNYVLTQFLGMCPFFGVSKKTESALGMGLSVLFVMTIASILTHLFYQFILLPLNITYLQTMAFILIIASVVQFVEVFMKKTFRALYSMLGIYLPMITTNCAIFGVTLINIKDKYTLVEAIVNSVGAGAGFLLAMVLLAAIREKYDNHPDVPLIFRGFPLALFSAGLMSIAFLGFQGMVLGR